MNNTAITQQPTQKSQLPLFRVISWLVTLLVPVFLTVGAVRLMLSPLFINIEYRLPGFPVDRYGFTTEERLEYANLARIYLVNSADISFLGDLRFKDGTPMYNPRELSHMVDVKTVVQGGLLVWYFSLFVLIGSGLWAWFAGWWPAYARGLGRGGWLTMILLGLLLFLVLLSFRFIFVAFHNIFFASGTWTFNYSDTLIRLFPERFWFDVFIAVGGVTLLGGLALGLLFGRKSG